MQIPFRQLTTFAPVFTAVITALALALNIMFYSAAPKKVKQYGKAFERDAKRLLKNELEQYKKSIPKVS